MTVAVQLQPKIRRKRTIVSLTPLIDIIFILLLFFMLTTQFNQLQGTTITVGTGTTSSAVTEDENSMYLLLLPEQKISINGQPSLAIENQSVELAIAEALTNEIRMVVDFDDAVTLQQMTELLDRLHRLDVPDESLKINL